METSVCVICIYVFIHTYIYVYIHVGMYGIWAEVHRFAKAYTPSRRLLDTRFLRGLCGEYMSHSLNSFKGVIYRIIYWHAIGVIGGDSRSLDSGSHDSFPYMRGPKKKLRNAIAFIMRTFGPRPKP